jgi:hypothetical protein
MGLNFPSIPPLTQMRGLEKPSGPPFLSLVDAMQLPPVDRTANGPSFGADLQPAAGEAPVGTAPRATRTETRVLQEQAAQQPEPSVRVELSAQADALIRSGRMRAEDDARVVAGASVLASAGGPSPVTGPQEVTGLQPIGAQAVGQSTSPLAQADTAQKAETPEALAKYLSTGQTPGPDEPTATKASSTDWTEKPKVEEEKPPEPPKEPISKKLLEFLQSLWRAGGNAIDVAQNGNQVLNPNKEADGPLTYSDPSAKKTTGL